MRRALSLSLVGLLAGCTWAPPYQRPALPVPQAFPQGGAYQAADADKALPPDWKSVFLDPRLQGLIETALKQNRNLRQTVANVRAAHAQFEVQRAALFPMVNATGTMVQQHLPTALGGGAFQPSRYYEASLGVSSYEVDLFGRLRSLSSEAFEQYLASDEGRRSAEISLAAEVADAYLTLAADRELLAVSRDTQTSAQKSLDLTQGRFNAGVASELDVDQAQTVVQQARANAAAYAVSAAQAKDNLDLLVGQAVAEDQIASSMDEVATSFAPIRVGLNSSVLLERPDVLQAEHTLKAANADIGAARAAFLPQITLTGQDGFASTSLNGLFKGPNNSWSFTPSVTIPIFAGGRNLGNLHTSQAQRDADVAAYENVVQSAFKDVADALASTGGTVEQVNAQQALVVAANKALTLSTARYERGADTYLNALDAQRTFYAAQLGLVTARLSNLSGRVSLYRALGGWAPSSATDD